MHRQALLQCIEEFLKKPEVMVELPSKCRINSAAWERCIHTLLQPVALDHSHAVSTPIVFLLDDNFYYPSMRYEVHQLARKCKVKPLNFACVKDCSGSSLIANLLQFEYLPTLYKGSCFNVLKLVKPINPRAFCKHLNAIGLLQQNLNG